MRRAAILLGGGLRGRSRDLQHAARAATSPADLSALVLPTTHYTGLAQVLRFTHALSIPPWPVELYCTSIPTLTL